MNRDLEEGSLMTEDPTKFLKPKRLIIVCCHAIWKGGQHPNVDEDEWLLEPFQRNEHTTFYEHVVLGIQSLKEDDEALLCFSGGATKQLLTSLAEGESYLNLAKSICPDMQYQERMIAETFATDSYQNSLFSLIAYRSKIGDWPEHVTIISHEFKRKRFIEEHRKAIKWPADKLTFKGLNPPERITPSAALEQSESANRSIWQSDLYGISQRLAGKRKARGWQEGVSLQLMGESNRYVLDPEIRQLLEYGGGDHPGQVFAGPLPWDPDPTYK